MEWVDVSDLVEERITSPVKKDRKKIIIVRNNVEVDDSDVEQYYPVKVDNKEFIPSTATWKAYCGDFEEAIDMFIQYCVDEDSKDYRVFYNLAYCFNALEQYTQAMIALDFVTSVKPDFVKGHYLKAQVLTSMKEFVKAEKILLHVNRLVEGQDEEITVAIRSNIFECLISEGYDPERAGFGSQYHPDIESAKHAIVNYEYQMACKLHSMITRYRLCWKKTRQLPYLLYQRFCERKWKEFQTDSCTQS